MNRWNKIEVTPSDLKRLKALYTCAAEAGDESFWWLGREVLTSYAKYLIEYFEMEYGPLEKL